MLGDLSNKTDREVLDETVEALARIFDIQERLESGRYYGIANREKIKHLNLPILTNSAGAEYVQMKNTVVYLTEVDIDGMGLYPIEIDPYKEG